MPGQLKRTLRLLNANFGKTCLYTKTGYQTKMTWSDLPGGNRSDSSDSHQTLLDGIHCEATNTFYVLDFVHWNGMSYKETLLNRFENYEKSYHIK